MENNSFTQFIPWDYLVDDFTIINKNNALQRTFKVKNYDMDYFTEEEIRIKLKEYNKAFTRLPNNFMIHYEVQRKKVKKYINRELKDCPYPIVILNKIREIEFKKNEYYQCDYYITLTYLLDTDTNDKILEMMGTKKGNKKENIINTFKEKYEYFNEKCIEFIKLLEFVTIELELLEKDDLMGYLHSTINPEFIDRKKTPEIESGFPLDYYLSQSSFEFGKNCKIGDNYLKTISIMKFPESINPLFFTKLLELDFEFRLSTRYIILSHEETKKSLLNMWRFHEMSQKSEFQIIYEGITKKEIGKIDKVELEKTNETEEAIKEFREGGINYGYYSFTIIIWDKNLKKLEENIRKIKTIMINNDIEGGEDKFNVKESFIGAIPGSIRHNIRKYTLNSFVLTGLMPNSTSYQGESWNNHLNDIPLLTVKTRENDIYNLNLHVKDVGHSILVGESGTGKSVALGIFLQAFFKYKNSQVFLFDYKGSSRVLTACMGGKYYDLGMDDKLKFQPLATVDTEVGKAFANNWILTLLEIENIKLTPEIKEIVWQALTVLESLPKNRRTLSTFENVVRSFEIKQAVKIYTIAGSYGKYFDGDIDMFSNERWQVFEMEYVVKDEKVVPLLLKLLFYKIEVEKLNKGYPTIIGVDETGVLFKNLKEMEKGLDDWLVTLRKLNTLIIFAFQNLHQMKNLTIYPAMKGNCKTKIFLPDKHAETSEIHALYSNIGLNDKEINTLSELQIKKDYLLQNDYGTNKFELELTPLEIAIIGSTGIKDQIKIMEIMKETNDIKEINLKWIEYKFSKNSEEYEFIKKIIEGE